MARRAGRAADQSAVLHHQRAHAPAERTLSSDAPPLEPASADASRRTNRGTHTVEMAREGVPLIVIQRQLGHSNLGITSLYLQGIDNAEIIDTSTPGARP